MLIGIREGIQLTSYLWMKNQGKKKALPMRKSKVVEL
jgi:hypothetical protein